MGSREPVCQRLESLRKRLDRLKQSWPLRPDLLEASEPVLDAASFQKHWQTGWLRITGLLGEIDQMLGRSRRRTWDAGQPAILRFPPAEEGATSIGSL